MTQNISTAVMQRRVEPHDSLDDFPTPPWATRALCEWIRDSLREPAMDESSVREPAANRGHMVRPLSEYFEVVHASDVHDYGAGFEVRDYLFGPAYDLTPSEWTITNPPFKLAEQFIKRALETSTRGVAMIVRAAFLESVGRYDRLFRQTPPAHVLQFTERVVMHKGKLSPDGSTATAYTWLVWVKGPRPFDATQLHWIAPCRKRLEKPEDYATARARLAAAQGLEMAA